MVPKAHGDFDRGLTPVIDLWPSRSGRPWFVGREGEDWWWYLMTPEGEGEGWRLCLGPDGTKPHLRARLYEVTLEGTGRDALVGSMGRSRVIAMTNPPGSKLPAVSVYRAVVLPAWRLKRSG